MSFAITASVIAAGGAIGGAVISANAAEDAQNRGMGLQQQGLNALGASQKDLLGSAPYMSFVDLMTQFSKQPQTFGPGDLESIKARATGEAHQGARNTTMAAWERAGATGSYRDGSTRAVEGRIGQQLGGRLGDISRQVDEMGARQRYTDLAQFGSLLQNLFQLRQGPAQAFSNAAIGVGSEQAGYNASPAGDALKGVGTIGTAIGSAKRSDGGTLFGDLFG